MERKECIYVQELLPLYAEDVCSPQCSALIRQHLECCNECRTAYEENQKELVTAYSSVSSDTDGPKEPFRRVRRHYRIRALVTVAATIVLLASSFLTLGSIGGDGIGWGSVFGWRCAEKAMEAIVNKDEKQIARYVDFQPGEGPQNADSMLERIAALEQQGLVLLGSQDHLQPLDDGFVYCAASLSVEYKEVEYELLFVGQYTGKAAFAYPQEIWAVRDGERRRIDVNEMPAWMEDLCRAVSTYYPG